MKIKNRSIYNSLARSAKLCLFIVLFLAAFLERTVLDLGPNIELVTASMILASYYLGRKHALWLVLAIMVATDLVLGNTSIFLFTWSGFLVPALLASGVFRKLKIGKFNLRLRLFSLTGTGVAANLFFYLWTNFGVWLLDSWEMYGNDLSGLVRCYINALPFLKNQLISSLIFIPLGFFITEMAMRLAPKLHSLRLPKMLWS